MSRLLLFVSFLFVFSTTYSQDYLEKIANKSCECLSEITDTLDLDVYQMKVGLCIIEASMPYKKQLKKNDNIDLDQVDKAGEDLGLLIAMKMAPICPVLLLEMARIANKSSDDKPVTKTNFPVKKTASSGERLIGTVEKIENDFFIIFSIKEEGGKTTKFYWTTYVQTSIDLQNDYNTLLGKSVIVTYRQEEYFDPKLSDYRMYNLINTISVME